MCLLNCFILYNLRNLPLYTAHGNRQLTFRRNLVRQLIDTFASRKRTGRKRSSPIGTAFPNLFHFLQKVSGRAKVCVSSVTFHCAVWDVFWNTTNSEMWRCKIRLVGYHIHKFITNKMKKSYHSAFFSLIVMNFIFLEGRSVSGVVRTFKWLLKNAAFLSMQYGFKLDRQFRISWQFSLLTSALFVLAHIHEKLSAVSAKIGVPIFIQILHFLTAVKGRCPYHINV